MNLDRRSRWAVYALLMVTSFVFALPLMVMVSGSLKSGEQLVRDPFRLWPEVWNWSNYPAALDAMPFLTYLTNTLMLCVGCVMGTTLSCALVAYGLARIQWRGRGWMFALVVGTMLLPWHITMIPRFVLIRELG